MAINKYHMQVLVLEAVALIAACLIVFGVLWLSTLARAVRAEAFLQDVTRLEVGKSTFEEVKSLAEKHAGQPEPGWGSCTYQACKFKFLYENKPLSSTYLETHFGFVAGAELKTGVPYVGLLGVLNVNDGVLTERYIHYVRYSKRPFAYNVREVVLPEGNSPEDGATRALMGFSRMNVDSAGIPSAISIGLSPATNKDERRRAYALNVSCLSKIFGCSGPSAIFPPDIPYRGTPYQTSAETW